MKKRVEAARNQWSEKCTIIIGRMKTKKNYQQIYLINSTTTCDLLKAFTIKIVNLIFQNLKKANISWLWFPKYIKKIISYYHFLKLPQFNLNYNHSQHILAYFSLWDEINFWGPPIISNFISEELLFFYMSCTIYPKAFGSETNVPCKFGYEIFVD